jgi:hypothetical protein
MYQKTKVKTVLFKDQQCSVAKGKEDIDNETANITEGGN